MEQWYTLYTKPNAEYQVATNLKQRDIQTFLPEIKAPKSRKERKKKPFFPCYLFTKIDLEEEGLSAVRWTPGLRRIVTFGERPVPLPDEIIDLIRYKLGEIEAGGEPATHPFKPGDTVRITEGPFKDMLAIFDKSLTANQRVQVLLNILGHASRVEVEVNELEEASADAEALSPKPPRRTRGRGRFINK